MKLSTLCWGLLIFLTLAAPLQAQEIRESSRRQHFPISVAIINHSWAMPFSRIFRLTPIYPGLTVGTEVYYRKKTRSQLFQSFEMGGFINNSSGSALYGYSNFGYRRTAKSGIRWDVALGLGYFHSYYTGPTYQLGTDGQYKALSKSGVSASLTNLSLGLGYDLHKVSNHEATAFIKYQWMVSTHYWSLLGIRPNGLLHLGLQFNALNRNRKS